VNFHGVRKLLILVGLASFRQRRVRSTHTCGARDASIV
jgi:hypothetical protein